MFAITNVLVHKHLHTFTETHSLNTHKNHRRSHRNVQTQTSTLTVRHTSLPSHRVPLFSHVCSGNLAVALVLLTFKNRIDAGFIQERKSEKLQGNVHISRHSYGEKLRFVAPSSVFTLLSDCDFLPKSWKSNLGNEIGGSLQKQTLRWGDQSSPFPSHLDADMEAILMLFVSFGVPPCLSALSPRPNIYHCVSLKGCSSSSCKAAGQLDARLFTF